MSRMLLPLLLIVVVLQLVDGFIVLNRPQLCLKSKSTTLLSSTPNNEQQQQTDDYDDWYADFDPADYEDVGGSSSTTSSSYAGGGHDYTRDLQADNSNVDESTINNLIGERLSCRKTGRFQEADAIRDTLLKDHGVAIFDREKMWRTGCSTSGSGMKWRPGNQQRNKRPRDFGPNGHDYDLARDAGPNTSSLNEKEIHSLLAERLEYKMSRDFQSADGIQDQLIQAGVYVHDGNKEWRADGKSFGDFSRGGRPGREFNSRSDRNRPYEQSPHSLPTEDAETIQDLVKERMDAKRVRDYNVADDIRDELRAEFNVEVNDRLRQWSVGGDFGIPQRDTQYSMSEESETPDNAEQVQQLVEERNEARKKRDFDTADTIREDLLDQNIMIDDKLRQWAVGGRFSAFNKRNMQTSFNTPFVKRGDGGDLTPEQEALIQELLQERSDAKRDKAFGKADRIRDRLQADFKVRIDDRAREWHVVSDKYAMNPVSEIDEDIRALIEERIIERSVAKLERDYETADAIRDELAEVYKVDLDDRVREWRIIGAPMVLDDVDTVFEVDGSDFEVDEDEEDSVEEKAESGSDDIGESIESEDLEALTIPELKVRLREAGLPVSGRKAELIERLSS